MTEEKRKRKLVEKTKQTKLSLPFFNFQPVSNETINKKPKLEKELVEFHGKSCKELAGCTSNNVDIGFCKSTSSNGPLKRHEKQLDVKVHHVKSTTTSLTLNANKFDSLKWKHIRGENLNVDHTILFSNKEASALMSRCEKELEYFTGDLSKVQIFGKWMEIPRKQVCFFFHSKHCVK